MFLAEADPSLASVRGKALHHLLELNWELSALEKFENLCSEAVTLAGELEDSRTRAWLLCSIGFVNRSEAELRRTCLEEALAVFRQIGDTWGICETLGRLAVEAGDRGDFARAGILLEETIGLAREAGDKSVLAFALCLSASLIWYYQRSLDPRTAANMYQEALTLFRELHYKNGINWALLGLGQIAYAQGENVQARMRYTESLVLSQQIGSKGYIMDCVLGLANLLNAYEEPERAARLLGAIHAPFHALWNGDTLLSELDRLEFKRSSNAVRAQLGEAAFEAAFSEGQMMTLDQAVTDALADVPHGAIN